MEGANRAVHNLNPIPGLDDPPSLDQDGPISPPTSAPPIFEPWSVEKVLSTLPYPPPSTPPTTPLPFLHLLERLKTTPREGWRRFQIPSPESISDHMYRMSILTLLCPTTLSSRINTSRATLLALIHDIAESLVGDLTPLDKVPKAEKHRREALTIEYLTSSKLLPPSLASTAGATIREAWHEYEENQTLEAKYVHDIDKLELLIQMVEYERREKGRVDLGEFMWVSEQVRLEEMKAWCEDVLREREEFWKGVWAELQEEEQAGERGNQVDGEEAGEEVGEKEAEEEAGEDEAGDKEEKDRKKRKEAAETALRNIEMRKSKKKQNNQGTPTGDATHTEETRKVVNGAAATAPDRVAKAEAEAETEAAAPASAETQKPPTDSPRPKTPKTPSKKDTIAMELSKYGSPDKSRTSKDR